MEAAERVITSGGHEAVRRDARLGTEIRHELIQRIAIFFLRFMRRSPKIGDRLKMDPAHTR